MKNLWKITLAAGVLGVGIAVLAMDPFKNPKVVQELGLSPQQVQQLEALRYTQQRQMIDTRHDLALKRLALEQEMAKDNPDPKVLDRLTDELGAIRTTMAKDRIHHMLDVKKILTPEQWQKGRAMLMEFRAERRGARRGRMGRNGQGRGWNGPGGGMGPGGGPGMAPAPAPDPGPGPGPDDGGPTP